MKKLLYILLFVPLALFGQENYSLSFDGLDDYVEISSNETNLDFYNKEQISITSWVNLNSIEGQSAIFINTHENSILQQYAFKIDLGRLYFISGSGLFEDNGYNLSNTILPMNQWVHVTFTYDSEFVRFYVNGELDFQNEVSDSFPNLYNEVTYIGRSQGANNVYFDGLINEVSIWENALSQEEIQYYMNCNPTGTEEGLVGYWNFNEGTGDTVYDYSGNGNHGTIYGATYSDDVPESSCLIEEGSTLSQIYGLTYGGFYDGSYYYASNAVDNWSNADSICSSYEGHLATIQNSNQNEFISSLINPEYEDAWIGLSNYANGDYVWIDDSEVIFTNWASEEPGGFDANGNPENFGLIHITGTWNDGYDYTLHQFIMEIVAIYGCIDSEYYNYNPQANTDDGSCMSYEEYTIDNLEIANQILLEESSLALSSIQQALDTWNTTIDLSAGWNMFGYGCPSLIDVAEGLSNHTESILITKDNNGNVYMPEWDFNGIGDFSPGFGYQIKVTEAIEGFSLCDWYVNDIPEDNIITLQEENAALQTELDSIESFIQNGDEAHGGIVFHVDSSGLHGLVAYYEDFALEWEEGIEFCDNFESNSYNDWYLPSISELVLMHLSIGIGTSYENLSNISSSRYWSSSSSNPWAWHYKHPLGGYQAGPLDGSSLNNNYLVRPIRSF
jgi:hypothetical protein